MTFDAEYSTDLFDASTIGRLAKHYEVLLEGVCADPRQRVAKLPLLTEAEKHQILVEWNREGDAFSLALAQHAAQQVVLNYLQPAHRQAAPKSKGTRGWIVGLVVVFVGLPILAIVLLLSQTDRVIDWAVDQIPVEVEKKLGAHEGAIVSLFEEIERLSEPSTGSKRSIGFSG